MNQIEQRVKVKSFFLKGHGNKVIQREFVNTLQDNAIPLSDHQFPGKSFDDICFAAHRRLILDAALSEGLKSNQDLVMNDRLPALKQARTGNGRHKVAPILIVHRDSSMRHKGSKITKKMA
jgi:hypothetical protein